MQISDSRHITEYLRSHAVFSSMPSDMLQTLTDTAKVLNCDQGDFLFRQDDSANCFYIVISGTVSVEIPSIYGPPLVVQTLNEDEILGWSWLISPYKWTFKASCETETQLLQFDGVALRDACEADPILGYQLLKRFASLMSERLHEARRTMMDNWSAPGFA